jgi:hypothetical protein
VLLAASESLFIGTALEVVAILLLAACTSLSPPAVAASADKGSIEPECDISGFPFPATSSTLCSSASAFMAAVD